MSGPLAALVTVAAALLASWGLHLGMRRRGLLPPLFSPAIGPTDDAPTAGASGHSLRLSLGVLALAFVLWIGIFLPLSTLGESRQIDFQRLETSSLFFLHLLLLTSLGIWYVAGFVGADVRGRAATDFLSQFGFRAKRPALEMAIGLGVGLGAWISILLVMIAIALTIWALGGEDFLPQQPPELIPWIAALPVALRLALSLSAGIVEETFFRGFLQPRVGIVVSTLLFTLAHASYEQPLMLVGILLLSLVFAFVVRWRQNIWPAIVAHALFDAIQLLIVIPSAMEILGPGGEEGLIPLASSLLAQSIW